MVAAAGVAGAASRGAATSSMKIKGTMDTSNIDRGFARVGQGFEGVKGQGKSFGADMQRVATTVSGLAKKLLLMGMAGTAALVGIASKAPAVAPAMARMSVSMGKIQRSLGEALAPAFEKVAGWLDKLAVWVDTNKEKIGEVADKFLDWAAAVGEKLWPWLEKIGNWAMDHPGLFTGIVAGLALAPAVITGIASISSLIGVMTGATVSASLLSAFAYLVALGAVSYMGYKAMESLVDKAQTYTGMTGAGVSQGGTDMSGQTLVNRLPDKIWSDITGKDAPWEDQLDANSPAYDQAIMKIKAGGVGSGGTMSAAEDRRSWFMQWWQATWG